MLWTDTAVWRSICSIKARQRFVAAVKVADKYAIPPYGAVIEIHLYAMKGGGIMQPDNQQHLDFRVGRRLRNLPSLWKIVFQANRRLLQVERLTHDCILPKETFRSLNGPVKINGQFCHSSTMVQHSQI